MSQRTNSAPTSRDTEIVVERGTKYTFKPSDFAYADAEGDPMQSIVISRIQQRYEDNTTSVGGEWRINGRAVGREWREALGTLRVSASQISNGRIEFWPDTSDEQQHVPTYMEYQVSDGRSDSEVRTLEIRTKEENVAPRVGKRIGDQVFQIAPDDGDRRTNERADVRFTLSEDSFVDDGPLRYEATLGDGSPLPYRIRFDSATRTFTNRAYDYDYVNVERTETEIIVKATDTSGQSAQQSFRLIILAALATIEKTATIAATADEIDEGETAEFTVTLSEAAPIGGVTVGYAVTHPRSWMEYTNVAEENLGTRNVDIEAGDTSATIEIDTTVSDVENHPTEVVVTLERGDGYTIAEPASAKTTVRNTTARVWRWDYPDCKAEVNESEGAVTLYARTENNAEWARIINFTSRGATAKEGIDYELAGGGATVGVALPREERAGLARIRLAQDERPEPDKKFTLNLLHLRQDPSVVSRECSALEVTIKDDDTAEATLRGENVAEGETIEITVGRAGRELCELFAYQATVTPSGDTQVLTNASEQTLNIGICEKNAKVRFQTNQNAGADGDAKVTFTVTDASTTDPDYAGRVVPGDPITITVRETAQVGIGVVAPARLQTDESGAAASITLVLESEPDADVVITPASSDTGEATVTGAMTFTSSNWSTPQTMVVTGVDDNDADGDRPYRIDFTVVSTDTAYARRQLDSIEGVNVDNENGPTVTIGDAPNAEEGSPLVFPVTVTYGTGITARQIKMRWRAHPGGADAEDIERNEADLKTLSGTLIIPAGTTSTSLRVETVDDEMYEADEQVRVEIVSLENASTGTTTEAVGTITSSDPAPVLSIRAERRTIKEGEKARFHLEMDRPAQGGATIELEIKEESTRYIKFDHGRTRFSYRIRPGERSSETEIDAFVVAATVRSTNTRVETRMGVRHWVVCGGGTYCARAHNPAQPLPEDLVITVVDNGVEPPASTRPDLTLVSGDGWAELQWTAPAEAPSGASKTITHYEYRVYEQPGRTWDGYGWVVEEPKEPWQTIGANERSLRVEVANRSTRTVELRAVDDQGKGPIVSGEVKPRVYKPAPANRLVSNIEATRTARYAITEMKQRFRTGAHPNGYRIEGVDFYPNIPGRGKSSTLTVQLCKSGDTSTCAALTAAHGAKTDRYVYNTTAEYIAEAETDYEVWVRTTEDAVRVLGTRYGTDPGSEPGWEIPNHKRFIGAVLMRVRGEAATATPQVSAPAVESATLVEAPGEDGWDAGESIEARLAFDEAVTVDTTNGTPSVTLALGGEGAQRSAAYASGSGTQTLAFRLTLGADEEGEGTVGLVENSLALNGATIRSQATQADAALTHSGAERVYARPVVPRTPAPTARFDNIPASHDGTTPFTVHLALSTETTITSYTTVRDTLIDVSGGRISEARRATQGSNVGWILTVHPDGSGAVRLTLPVRPCGAANAVCVEGKPLAEAAHAQIAMQGFSASFDGAPAEHDGESFKVNFRMSAEPAPMSYTTVRDDLFRVEGGSISNVRRLAQGRNKDWEIEFAPSGYEAVSIALVATTSCNGRPGVCSTQGSPLAGPLTLTVQGPPTISVADAEAEEGPQATLDFIVTLSRALAESASVAYATSDDASANANSATAGTDYTAASGRVTFAPGETQKTIPVDVIDDAHDEGMETMKLTLSDAQPTRVKIATAEATGTISNTDPMPKAWMVRFAGVIGGHLVDAVDARLDAKSRSQMTVAGVSLGAGETVQIEDDDPFGTPHWARAQEEERTMSAREALLGSSFHVTSAGEEGAGPALSAWGRIAEGRFEAEEDEVRLDGAVTSALMGLDAEWERAIAGVMLSYSEGDGSYALLGEGEAEGTVDSTMTGLYPYASMTLRPGVKVWGLAGGGSGTITLRSEGNEPMATDMSMRIAAAGVRGALLDEQAGDPLALAVKADAMRVWTKSEETDELARTRGRTSRVRVALEAGRSFETTGGGRLRPSAEIGLRHDAGDAERGFGLEAGAGLNYSHGPLSIEGEVHRSITHETRGYEAWGASGAIGIVPGEDGRGLTLALRPRWGAEREGAESLWERQRWDGPRHAHRGSQLAIDAGYGIGSYGGVLTPYISLQLEGEAARDVRSGATWALGDDVHLKVEGQMSGSEDGSRSVSANLSVRF